MTEAGWTREKPIAAGWYWWRSLNGMIGPEIIQIDNTNGPDTDLEVIGPFGETPLDEWIAESEDEPGEWQGPLSPDSYHQGRVAGLRDAAEWLNYCLSIGWPKRDLDGLQRVFYRCRGWETFKGYHPTREAR